MQQAKERKAEAKLRNHDEKGAYAHEGLVAVEDLVHRVAVVTHLQQRVLLCEGVAALHQPCTF